MDVLDLTVEPDGTVILDDIDFNIALLVIVTEDGSDDFYEERSSINIGTVELDMKKHFKKFGGVKNGKIVLPLRKERGPQGIVIFGLRNVKEAVLMYTMEKTIVLDMTAYFGRGPITTNIINREDRHERRKISKQTSRCYSDGGFYLDGDYVVLPPGGILEMEYYEPATHYKSASVDCNSFGLAFLVSFISVYILICIFNTVYP
jgi:hypothetical protein